MEHLSDSPSPPVLASATAVARDLLVATDFDFVYATAQAATEAEPDSKALLATPMDATRLAHSLFSDQPGPVPEAAAGRCDKKLVIEATVASLQIMRLCCLRRSPPEGASDFEVATGPVTGDVAPALDGLCFASADIFRRLSALLEPSGDSHAQTALLAQSAWSSGLWFDSILQAIQRIPPLLENFALHEALVVTTLEASGGGWLGAIPHKRKLVTKAAKKVHIIFEGPVEFFFGKSS